MNLIVPEGPSGSCLKPVFTDAVKQIHVVHVTVFYCLSEVALPELMGCACIVDQTSPH